MSFNITFETITSESAENGDTASSGFIGKGLGLRDAIKSLGYPSQGFQIDDWITAYLINDGTREYYEEGISENRSFHFPDNITPASRERVTRLIESGDYY